MNLKPQQVIQSIKRLSCSLVSSKNFSKILPSNGLGPGPRWPKSPPVMTWLNKYPLPQAKNFFECRLEDLPCLLSLWTALYHFWRPSYTRAKPHAIWLLWHENPWKWPDAKVINGHVWSEAKQLQEFLFCLMRWPSWGFQLYTGINQ